MKKLAAALIAVLAMQIASCQAAPTPTPTRVPPTAVRISSTVTPLPTVTTVPAATSVPPTASPSPTQSSRRALIDSITNQVETRASAAGTFAAAKIGDFLNAGSQARTGNGSEARLAFGDGTYVHLAQNTTLTIEELGITSGAPLTRLQIESGRMWIGQSSGVMEIKTAAGTATSRGSYADLQGLANGQVLYYIIYGSGAFANTNLSTRQGIKITPGGQPTLVEVSLAQIVDFADHNGESCGALAQALGMRKGDVCGYPNQDSDLFNPTPVPVPNPRCINCSK